MNTGVRSSAMLNATRRIREWDRLTGGGEVDLLVIAAQDRGDSRAPTRAHHDRSVNETLLGTEGCDVLIVPTGRGDSVVRIAHGSASLGDDASHRHR